MLPLVSAGYRVIAPDLRGYGRTTGWDPNYDCDLRVFGVLNMVRDVLGLVSALGYRSVSAVVGRDAGSTLAGWCTLLRVRLRVLQRCPLALRPMCPPFPASTHNWQRCPVRESTTKRITRRGWLTAICEIARKDSTHSSVVTSTTRARTGKRTNRFLSSRVPPRKWQRCPLTT
jgi:hypothetical protein